MNKNLVFSSVASQIERTQEERRNMEQQVFNLHVYNVVAEEYMNEAFDLIDDEGLAWADLKDYRKLCASIYKDYTRKIKSVFEDAKAHSLLYDLATSYCSEVSKEYQIFYLAILQNLSNHGIKRKEILAYLTCAVAATDIAIYMFDCFFEDYRKKIGEDVSKPYSFMRLDKLKLNLKRVQQELAKRENGAESLDLTKDDLSLRAYDALINKISNVNTLNRAAMKALQQNHISTTQAI